MNSTSVTQVTRTSGNCRKGSPCWALSESETISLVIGLLAGKGAVLKQQHQAGCRACQWRCWASRWTCLQPRRGLTRDAALLVQWCWRVRPACCHSLRPAEFAFPAPPTATMSGWAKLQWTFLNPRHHLPVPLRAGSDLLMERGMAKSITCFNFFIHLITLKALRICSASLGTLQWLQRMFMAGNDHLIRTEAPSHPRCWWTLKPGDGRGCIFSDEVNRKAT